MAPNIGCRSQLTLDSFYGISSNIPILKSIGNCLRQNEMPFCWISKAYKQTNPVLLQPHNSLLGGYAIMDTDYDNAKVTLPP